MKRITIILAFLALLPFSRAFAQVGEIIYRDFDPDSCVIYWIKLGPVWIDLDADGEAHDLYLECWQSGWICAPEFAVGDFSNIRICTLEADDTDIALTEIEEENWTTYIGWMGGSIGCVPCNYTHYGFRIRREDNYYYGWFERCSKLEYDEEGRRKVYFCVDRTAYCTIPNYPLRWGQTSITGVNENESSNFATVHPNPTTGIVHVEGTKAAEVQVYDVLGQCVKTFQNTNEISLEGLPQGVYLLRVTTEDGKVFSDQVVKE
jgi:hypothetical protein